MFSPIFNGGLFANALRGNLGQQVANRLSPQTTAPQANTTTSNNSFANLVNQRQQQSFNNNNENEVNFSNKLEALEPTTSTGTSFGVGLQAPDLTQQQPVAPAVQPSLGSGLPFNNLTGDEMQRAMAFANRRFMPFFGSPFGGGGFGRMSPYGFNQFGGFGFQNPYQQQFVNQNSLANMFGRGLFSGVPFRMF